MPYKDPNIRRQKQGLYTARYRTKWTQEQWDQFRKKQREAAKKKWSAATKEEKSRVIEQKRLKYNNDEKTRTRRWKEAKMRYYKLREEVIKRLGERCSNPNCKWRNEDGTLGCTDYRCLHIDHVHGGGRKELLSMSSYAYLKKVLADTEGLYQLLCANCNFIKRRENKEFSKGRPPINRDPEPLVDSSS